MPTFLVNPKMSAALALRVEASVGGRSSVEAAAFRSKRRLGRALLRLAVVACAVFAVASVWRARRRERAALERAREELVADRSRRVADLAEADLALLGRVEPWLVRSAQSYEGDVTAPELRSAADLAGVSSRPLLYVRGPIGAFRDSLSIADAASSSYKDALLVCVVDPPAARTEKALLPRVLVSYGGGAAVEQATPNARLLQELEASLPVLDGRWSARVRSARSLPELDKLRRELGRAPVERGVQAAKAEILMAVLDEPGPGEGPTELDGERPHDVRVAIVDIARSKILLRVRRHADPAWISEGRRPRYAAGLDGCAIALDIAGALAAKH
jgi:hypothetical protein